MLLKQSLKNFSHPVSTYFTSSTPTTDTKIALYTPFRPLAWRLILSNVSTFYGFCALKVPPNIKPLCQPFNTKLSSSLEPEIYQTEQTNVQRQSRILSYFLVALYCCQIILSLASLWNHTMAQAAFPSCWDNFMPYNVGQYSNFEIKDRKLFYKQMKLFQLAYTCSDYKIFTFLDQLKVQFTFKYS